MEEAQSLRLQDHLRWGKPDHCLIALKWRHWYYSEYFLWPLMLIHQLNLVLCALGYDPQQDHWCSQSHHESVAHSHSHYHHHPHPPWPHSPDHLQAHWLLSLPPKWIVYQKVQQVSGPWWRHEQGDTHHMRFPSHGPFVQLTQCCSWMVLYLSCKKWSWWDLGSLLISVHVHIWSGSSLYWSSCLSCIPSDPILHSSSTSVLQIWLHWGLKGCGLCVMDNRWPESCALMHSQRMPWCNVSCAHPLLTVDIDPWLLQLCSYWSLQCNDGQSHL